MGFKLYSRAPRGKNKKQNSVRFFFYYYFELFYYLVSQQENLSEIVETKYLNIIIYLSFIILIFMSFIYLKQNN